MKVNDKNSRIRFQDPDPNPDPNPDPDPLVRGMDPRIRILIHPKMSWIRNTAYNRNVLHGPLCEDSDKIFEDRVPWTFLACVEKSKSETEKFFKFFWGGGCFSDFNVVVSWEIMFIAEGTCSLNAVL